ncbi:hypothetical protein VIBNIWn13_260052 [Vibrio nigripulchritudo Wn13]|nr:hypothetical protein VIBNIENn2_490053 [Vibrio nigripulchritudo ENn2]CCO42316.1 hypothetical protein VIBNISFn135_800052 [Vibrio nigripulchritudo SFn135]CCO52211.1 hypothetical protein VIBNIWn13_260052 [Vibrio nigripulchritudo Wn13]
MVKLGIMGGKLVVFGPRSEVAFTFKIFVDDKMHVHRLSPLSYRTILVVEDQSR